MRLEKALNNSNSNSNRILLLKLVSSPGIEKKKKNKKGTIIEMFNNLTCYK